MREFAETLERVGRWVRHVHADPQLRGMFPDVLTQSGYHKRLKTAEPRSRSRL